MKNHLISANKARRILNTKAVNFVFMTVLFSCMFCVVPVFAATDALTSVKDLMTKAAIAGGSLWAAWGAVLVGVGLRDHNGPGISGGLWQVLGGGVIVAAGAIIGSVDLSFTTTTAAIYYTTKFCSI